MKTFIEFFVKNRSFTMVILFLMVALGMNSLINMPRGEDPESNFPLYNIVTINPGASPADIEDQITDPIEKRFNEVKNVRRIKSISEDGLSVVTVEYEFGVNLDEKYQEVIRELNAIRDKLPSSIYSQEVKRVEATDVNIYQIALVSETATYAELERLAEDFEDELEKVRDFKKVETAGYPSREVKVELNIEKMAQLNIPFNAVLGSLQSENLNIPGGNISMNARKFNVKTSGEYESIEDIRNTVVFTSGQKIILLKDIANVVNSYEEETHITRLNGKKAVLIAASQKEKKNIFGVSGKARPVIDAFEKQLPAHIKLVTNFDQSKDVSHRLSRFVRDFGMAILLVSITLLPLGFRAAIVVMISIPLSLLFGLFILDTLGITINQLSSVGLIVALGILVDDAIVIVENIERFMRNGVPRSRAVIESTSQIALAVIGFTVTLGIAFMPLVLLPNGAGDFIGGLPLAVITSVAASLLVSLTIIPFLSGIILKQEHKPEGNIFLRSLNKAVDATYGKLMKRALSNPIITLLIAGALFVGSLMLAPILGFSLFPRSEKAQFQVNVEMPNTATLYETDRVAKYVEGVLASRKDINHYTTNVGKGNPRVYYNVIQHNEASNFAQLFVQANVENFKEKNKIIAELRKTFESYANAKIQVIDYEQGPPLESPVAIRIFGKNLDTLRHLSLQVEKLIKGTPGSIYIFNPSANYKTDLKVKINKEKAGMLGIPIADIDRTVRMGIAGLPVGEFSEADGEDKINIVATLPKGSFQTFDVFDKIYVNSAMGKAVPLKHIANIEFESGPTSIRHFNSQRYATVNSYAKDGVLYFDLNKLVIDKLNKFHFPKGYHYVAAGELENQDDAFGGFLTIIIITVFAFIAILILEFGSFKSSLIVMSVIPLGMIGGMTALLIAGYTLSFTTMVGFIALVGIEIKNSILLVDYTNQLRSKGMELEAAIEQASEVRFIPILLTTLTAIGGLIPLVLENSPLYSPMACVLIGGLTSSLLLTRVVTPVLYKLLPPKIERTEVETEELGTNHVSAIATA